MDTEWLRSQFVHCITSHIYLSSYHAYSKNIRLVTLWNSMKCWPCVDISVSSSAGHGCGIYAWTQQSSRWQQEADASDHRGTDSDLLIDVNMTCLQPPSRPLSGRKQPAAPCEVQRKSNRSAFTSPSDRAAAAPKGCHFPACEWVAVGCGLSHSGPGLRRSVMDRVFRDPDEGGRRAAVGAKGPCGHTFLNSSSTAQNIRSSHANTAVTTSRFHSHI